MFMQVVGSVQNMRESKLTHRLDGESSLSNPLDTVSPLENELLSFYPSKSQRLPRGVLNLYSLSRTNHLNAPKTTEVAGLSGLKALQLTFPSCGSNSPLQ